MYYIQVYTTLDTYYIHACIHGAGGPVRRGIVKIAAFPAANLCVLIRIIMVVVIIVIVVIITIMINDLPVIPLGSPPTCRGDGERGSVDKEIKYTFFANITCLFTIVL